tara:strand:+ start:7206 stop:8936 length:1731 start_codon:yes stop_codon:yes gene_type:complete
MSLVLKRIDNPIPGSDKSPSDIDLKVMVLNKDKTAFEEQWKDLLTVKKVILKRFENQFIRIRDWYFPEPENIEQVKQFLRSEITKDQATTLIGDTVAEKADYALQQFQNNANRLFIEELYETKKQEILNATDPQTCVDILNNNNIFINPEPEGECIECSILLHTAIGVGQIRHVFNELDIDCAIKVLDKFVEIFNFETVSTTSKSTDVLGDKLVLARPDFLRFGSKEYSKTALDEMGTAIHCLWTPNDRTNTLTNNLKLEGSPIPDTTGFSKSFAEVADEKGVDLWNEDKELKVYWSGGIDSTVALISLLKSKPSDWHDKLKVVYTDNSIEEYSLFWNNYIKDKIRSEKVVLPQIAPDKARVKDIDRYSMDKPFFSPVLKHIADNLNTGLTITGECGDQLFGSSGFISNPSILNMSVDQFLEKRFPNHIDDIKLFNSKSPYRILSITDLFWWWNFNLKWEEVSHRSLALVKNSNDLNNVRHFFRTDDFQRWSILNPDEKIKDTLRSYKFTAKKYIYDYTSDEDYRDNKLKIGSLKVRWGSTLAIDNKNNIIYAGDTSTNTNLLKEKYGNSLEKFIN